MYFYRRLCVCLLYIDIFDLESSFLVQLYSIIFLQGYSLRMKHVNVSFLLTYFLMCQCTWIFIRCTVYQIAVLHVSVHMVSGYGAPHEHSRAFWLAGMSCYLLASPQSILLAHLGTSVFQMQTCLECEWFMVKVTCRNRLFVIVSQCNWDVPHMYAIALTVNWWSHRWQHDIWVLCLWFESSLVVYLFFILSHCVIFSFVNAFANTWPWVKAYMVSGRSRRLQ